MSKFEEKEKKAKALSNAHDRMVRMTMTEVASECARRKYGRPSVPEEKKREKFALRVYVNQEEKEAIKAFVGDRSTSDVVRSLIMNAIKQAK